MGCGQQNKGDKPETLSIFTSLQTNENESTDFLLFLFKPIKSSLVSRPAVAFVSLSLPPFAWSFASPTTAGAIILPEYNPHNDMVTIGERGWQQLLCASEGFNGFVRLRQPPLQRYEGLTGGAGSSELIAGTHFCPRFRRLWQNSHWFPCFWLEYCAQCLETQR